jgi:protein-S-isoprenylcysteine O-methyltransferase Ste14
MIVAWLSSVLGGTSLLCLGVFLWVGSFEVFPLGLNGAEVVIWNAALSCLFFVQHSGMIRRGFVRWSGRWIPAELRGAIYSIASGLALLTVLGLWQRSPVVVWSVDPPWSWLLRAGFVAAILLFVVGIRTLGGFDGFGLRPIRDRHRGRTRTADPLTVQGPYRWVRHPLYTGVLVMIWTCPIVAADRLVFNLLWSAWIVAGSFLEENDLIREFGDDYLRYRSEVPMLIPWHRDRRW